MNRKNGTIFFLFALIIVWAGVSYAQIKKEEKKNKRKDISSENAQCLRCHGKTVYTEYSKDSTKQKKKLTYSQIYIDSVTFISSVHGSFKCIDCHSKEYKIIPHSADLTFEDIWSCGDCHDGDKKFASFHFEEIENDFNESVHHTKMKKTFTCWECHHAHSFQNMNRSLTELKNVITYDNNICLNCHDNPNKLELFSTKKSGTIMASHSWLPNQELHFKNVRCIDCHSRINDSLTVAHYLMPTGKAVKNCLECHSIDSRIMGALYKFNSKENRKKYGFFNGVIVNEAYVIGANRNYFLNIASLVIFGLVLAGLFIHVIVRILLPKNKK